MNDGKPDNELYRLPDYQLNDKWSLQTDTAAYFLTVNFSGSNLHLQPTINNVAGNTLSPEPYFMRTEGLYYQHRINNGRADWLEILILIPLLMIMVRVGQAMILLPAYLIAIHSALFIFTRAAAHPRL
ncbi:MAG: hypothetical protein WDO71_03900 [Bacteroidota bacterium]